MPKKKRIKLVCFDCAKERGARIPEGHCYSAYAGFCDLCNKEKEEVTQPRDFGVTRVLLEN